MAGASKEYCPVCKDLYNASMEHQKPGHVKMARMGNPYTEMKRIYKRDGGGTYRGIGHICEESHVVLDDVKLAGQHVPTPAYPHEVVCLATGETVGIPA